MTEKLIRDALGDAVPQLQNEDGTFTVLSNGDPAGVDFGKKKLLRDALGTPLPMQYFDVELGQFVAGSLGGGEGGSATWSTIAGKPSQFPPSSHSHGISDITGLQEELNKVFTQVSNGKSLLETSILNKGGNVGKVEEVATFEELQKGIAAIPVTVTGGGSGGNVGGGSGGSTNSEIGVPLNRACKEYIEYSTLNVVEKINIELVEV